MSNKVLNTEYGETSSLDKKNMTSKNKVSMRRLFVYSSLEIFVGLQNFFVQNSLEILKATNLKSVYKCQVINYPHIPAQYDQTSLMCYFLIKDGRCMLIVH